MFGDFAKNFGLDFPFQGADPQGGLFGANTGPAIQDSTGGAAPAGPVAGPPAAQAPAAGAMGSQITNPTPLAGPLSPGQPQAPQTQNLSEMQGAPAAGVNSPFGKQL